MTMTSVMHTVDGRLYVECVVCKCVHVCLKKNQDAPRPSEHPPVLLSPHSNLCACVYTGTGGLRLSSTLRYPEQDTTYILSSAAGKPRYVELKRLR